MVCAIIRRAISCGRCRSAIRRFFIIVGIVEIVRAAYPDPTQFDPTSRYFDAKATVDAPRWDLVEVKFVRAFRHIIALDVLKAVPELTDMAVVRKGSRLSVTPVSPAHWQVVLALADAEEDSA